MQSSPQNKSPARRAILLTSLASGLGLLVLAGSLFSGCFRNGPPVEPASPPWFIEVTEERGLDFEHDAGKIRDYFLPQIMGSGVALFDFNNDGRLDIYLVHNGGPKGKKNQLFKQGPDGKFIDVSKDSGLDVAGFGMGVAIGDVNNDGYPDVLLTEYRGIRLFLNNHGDGTFTDVTKEAGLDHPHWATSACFVDYDRDGWLDLAVTNYASYHPDHGCEGMRKEPDYCPPRYFAATVTNLYRNLGRRPGAPATEVRFEDVTLKSGLSSVQSWGMGIVAADFDGDGWPDLLIANDSNQNRLFINKHNGTFVDEAVRRGIDVNRLGNPEGNMGIALGDVDGGNLLSVFITHLTEETNTLWVQGPPGQYRDRTAAAGLAIAALRATGFGTVMADFDNDGALDIAVANGRVTRGQPAGADTLGPFWCNYAERNKILAGDGKAHFRDISPDNDPFCGWPGLSRGLAVGDLDGDGGLDLIVTTIAGRARLFKNVAPNRGHWLSVRAYDPKLRRDSYGAEIKVTANSKTWVGWINPNQGYLSSNEPRAHFGLGKIDRIDSIKVCWPDGAVEEEIFSNPEVDKAVKLDRGTGKRVEKK